MLRLLDDQILRFFAYLHASGLRENTLVVFTSDHGDYAGDYGLQRKGVEIPECLIRIPLIFSGPGVKSMPSARPEFVSIVDLMPTLCEAVGAETPFGVQGRSLWPLLTGAEFPASEFRSIYAEQGFGGMHYDEDERPPLHFPYEGPTFDELNSVTQSGTMHMVRMGKWKLAFDMMGSGQLYDVEQDPGELADLFDRPELRDVRLAMAEELLRWSIRTEDDLPSGSYFAKRTARNWFAAAE